MPAGAEGAVRVRGFVQGHGARPAGAPGRRAIAVAGDDPDDVEVVAAIVDALGFDPVIGGPLAEGVHMEPGTEPVGANVEAAELRAMLGRFPESQRGREVLRARGGATSLPPGL
ncbi:hypothetical protein [Nonomuraea turkmeniaca]|uniref:hypothetical protein n=1 Tax=Nonomuraea turkmeniaca TaxID=103838 RepID=UPI001B869208|nr:hypothetical protein [Nonomuraea turkmeniaca]